jgi:tetratricopeptide (TPR) repeat protein
MNSDEQDRVFEAIVAAVTRGDRGQAHRLAIAGLREFMDEPLVLLLASEGLDEQGQVQEALTLLERAAQIVPEQAEVWRRLGGAMVRQARLADGLAAFEKALEIQPDIVATLMAAGDASYRLGALTTAEAYFRRTAELAPKEPDALAALATIAARRQKSVEARDLAERALAIRPNLSTAEMAIGRADLIDGLPEAARERMNGLLEGANLNDDSRVSALDLRAEAFDILDRPREAFADYEARNAILRRINAPRFDHRIERRVDQARRLTAYFSAAQIDSWLASAGEDEIGARTVRGHAFLLGFPRSGTTLLEKVFATHPAVATLEEVDHLAKAGHHFLADVTSLDNLARLTPALANVGREAYWRGVVESIGDDCSKKVVIDKLPLHTIALPVIAKLFPRAKIFFALRDPRDVVLSCFRRRFQINSAMFEFLNLTDAANYYDQVMTLARDYRRVLPLALKEVRHEAIVQTFEDEVRGALDFVGLGWDPVVTRFTERVRVDARTPSDIQIARGLNADGVGQWRRYERQIEPILGIVERWVREFGYSDVHRRDLE